MKFLLDENFPKSAGLLLEQSGHEVIDVRGTTQEGMSDKELFQLAQNEQAILLSTDRDFYHTIPYLVSEHHGVVVIALRQPNRQSILRKVRWLLAQITLLPLRNKVLLLRDSSFRQHLPKDDKP